MYGIGSKDGERRIDWGKASLDYARYRPGYPPEFFERTRALGVGRPGQRILDLGTGTGVLARAFARQGCSVVGQDIAPGQVETARRLADAERLGVEWHVGPAEETGLPDGVFDAITASQCWLYFDKERMVPEVKRLLKPGGILMTCHLSWLPRLDPVARASENLILTHNPDWSAADWSGRIPVQPAFAAGQFQLVGFFVYDQPLPFTRSSWRGRIRASRGIGATLTPNEVERFDAEHARLLESITEGDEFTVLHRIDAHLFMDKADG